MGSETSMVTWGDLVAEIDEPLFGDPVWIQVGDELFQVTRISQCHPLEDSMRGCLCLVARTRKDI